MKENTFKFSLVLVAATFVFLFFIILLPTFMENPDLISAICGGFVNPYATVYSLDAIFCWMVLFLWVVYESKKVKHGWVCLLIGIFPGVALGFATYLILRTRHKA